MKKEIIKCLVDFIKVFKTYGLFIILVAPPDPFHQHFGLGLEKNHQVGNRDAFLKELKHLLIKPELLVIKVYLCKNPVLVKKIVRYDGAFKKALLVKFEGMLISP